MFSFLFLEFFLTLGTMMLSFIALIVMVIDCDHNRDWTRHFKVWDANRKVGGIRFLKLGRLNVSFSISKGAAQ